MKKLLFTLGILFLLFQSILGQSRLEDGFFDYSVGNKWTYKNFDTGEIFTAEIESCTETDTLTQCEVKNFGRLLIQGDTLMITDYFAEFFASFYPDLDPGILTIYHTKMPPDSIWDACWDCSNSEGSGNAGTAEGFRSDTVKKIIWDTEVYTREVIVKQFKGDPLGEPSVQLTVAGMFGMYSIKYWHGDYVELIGAEIDGTTYGDVITSSEREEDLEGFVEEFRLSDAYPNPFNPSTSIELKVQKPQKIRISIYDITGRQVFSVAPKLYQQGKHRITLNFANLSTGIYLIIARSRTHNSKHLITKVN